ncbi:phospho-N-acetylmuramoyl-pentapeptide-transferase [Nocardioides mesophilus]|uniref:Phospho-N-acetylmuramoyl-pentapeptide-transferase n=1 Tax=Nocardioides mesophilus TaxID=433659 RepID=A0A7G9RDM6_9ACTN|nr:phospho-N-acetylmuramoyl-pentapeptide-transferase [Nocardioides mesophilus]QNN53701.1 phospho-N-acetylmuramoyl-pentapeptide-transferase [Nocardioides mesophilus]
MKAILLSGLCALIVSLFSTRWAIRQFAAWGLGQLIREDGPQTHHVKRGTPTMGGAAVVVSVVIGYAFAKLLTWDLPSRSALLVLFLLVGMAGVGFLDDFIKVRKQRSLGLRSKAKLVGQTVVSLTFGFLALQPVLGDGAAATVSHRLSFARDVGPALPWVIVIVLIWFMVSGTSNATNLIDGLDGLLTGSATMVFAAYAVIGVWQNSHSCGSANGANGLCYQVASPLDLATVAAALAGACFGFLWWNASPAQIIMGDTGSLALGAAMAGLALLTRTELLLIVLGGLYVAVTGSVLLQVSWFKLTRRTTGVGRRIFRMTPLHHHFELLGWEQVTVVVRFWIIAGVCAAAALGIFYSDWLGSQG